MINNYFKYLLTAAIIILLNTSNNVYSQNVDKLYEKIDLFSEVLKKIQDNAQIAFQYCDYSGNIDNASNPNGSLKNIAGVLNKQKNVIGVISEIENRNKIFVKKNKD